MVTTVKVDDGLAKEMGLTVDEFSEIKKLLGRDPNFTELGVFSAMWSEHCSYKNSRGIFKLFPTKGKQVLVGAGEENSGIIDIGDELGVSFKMESHNHPSAVEPFEASATGIGGCLRDIFTTGAKPVAVMGALRFGKLCDKNVKFLFKEVIRGLAHYANTAEVSVVGDDIYFDESYEGNPLVNALVVGIVKNKDIVKGGAYGVGNPVYYIGGDTGRDGVGGASFASKEITEESSSTENAVAIGDAELGKRLREACLELTAKGLVTGMQDMGAAGLTCSSCETASRSGTGIEIDVALVPQREKDMTPYEILLSESQERMLVILKSDKTEEALSVLKKWGVNAVNIGKVIEEKMMRVKENGTVVCEIPPEALTTKAPLYERETKEPSYLKDAQSVDYENLKEPDDLNEVFLRLLDLPTVASKESGHKKFTFIDKDEVLVGAGSDAAVVRVKGTKKALAISVGCNGRYCYLNPYYGAMMVVAEVARNIVCAGGKPLAITDGLNFGNPMKPESYWQFKKCVEGLSEACKNLNTPVVSGNVSFYNENPKGAIDPTPMVGMVGLIEDVDKYVTQDFKNQGDVIVLLGENSADLSGSEYLSLLHDLKRGNPRIDIEREKAVQETCLEAIRAGIVNSAESCSKGGLAVALFKSCIANENKMLGAEIKFNDAIRKDAFCFGEAPSRIIVSVSEDNQKALEDIAKKHSIPYSVLGNVGGENLTIRSVQATLVDLPLSKLSTTWKDAIPSRLEE